MHLVYKALQKEPVPMTLPPDLVPPAKRKKSVIASSVTVLPDLLVPTTGLNSPISAARPTTTMAVGLMGAPASGPTVVRVYSHIYVI